MAFLDLNAAFNICLSFSLFKLIEVFFLTLCLPNYLVLTSFGVSGQCCSYPFILFKYNILSFIGSSSGLNGNSSLPRGWVLGVRCQDLPSVVCGAVLESSWGWRWVDWRLQSFPRSTHFSSIFCFGFNSN